MEWPTLANTSTRQGITAEGTEALNRPMNLLISNKLSPYGPIPRLLESDFELMPTAILSLMFSVGVCTYNEVEPIGFSSHWNP